MYSFVVILSTLLLASNVLCGPAEQLERSNMVDTYATQLVGFLEDFKVKMRTGDEDLGLPVLDPFQSLQENIKFKKEGLVELTALLTNINATGLSNFVIHKGEFTIIGVKIKLDLSWPEVVARTNYMAQGVIGTNVNIYGNGHIAAKVKNLRFSTEVGLSAKSRRLYVRSIASKVSLGGLDFSITGLFDDEEVSALLSSIISDMAPQVINDYQKEVVKLVDETIVEFADDFLKDKSLKDLLDMIG